MRRRQRDDPDTPNVFVTERSAPTASAVRKLVARGGRTAGIGFPVHPHMLRHACGFKRANEGHDTRAIQHYLGHRNIQHTVWCTELAADRCNGFWKDEGDGHRLVSFADIDADQTRHWGVMSGFGFRESLIDGDAGFGPLQRQGRRGPAKQSRALADNPDTQC